MDDQKEDFDLNTQRMRKKQTDGKSWRGSNLAIWWSRRKLPNSTNVKPRGTSQLATQVLGIVLVHKERDLCTPQMSGIPLSLSLQIGNLCC